MKRRQFLQLAAGLGLSLPFGQILASSSLLGSSPQRKLVIGVGGCGNNIIRELKNRQDFQQSGYTAIAVNWSDEFKRPDQFSEYEKIQLGERQFKNSFSDIRAIKMALISETPPLVLDRVTPVLENLESLIVVAGFGSVTGSFIGLSLANASIKYSIPTLGIWITPFQFEGGRLKYASWLIDQGIVSRSSHHLISNEDVLNELGGNVPFLKAFNLANSRAIRLIMSHLSNNASIV